MTIINVLINCPDAEVAEAITGALLDRRLIAAANIHPEVVSHYV